MQNKKEINVSEIRKRVWNRDSELTQIIRAYLEAMLWSSTDYEGDPLDENYNIDDIADEFFMQSVEDCGKLYMYLATVLADIENEKVWELEELCVRKPQGCSVWDLFGQDLWLTRAGHGAGFWDGHWVEWFGKDLTEVTSHDFPNIDPYVGDDGKIYGM